MKLTSKWKIVLLVNEREKKKAELPASCYKYSRHVSTFSSARSSSLVHRHDLKPNQPATRALLPICERDPLAS